jgi:hypothetical protein
MSEQDNNICLRETSLQTLEDEQENRMRQSNRGILCLMDDEEKGNPSSYIVKLISEELGVDVSPQDLERCHRISVK